MCIAPKKLLPDLRKLGIQCQDDMYFRNTEGKDTLNGRNLLILGKPCPPTCSVMSLALSAGYQPTSTALENHRIRRQGYELNIYSFTDKMLHKLLLWRIDSETTQCIGRARLVWNDCEVLVAGLPVEI